MDCAYHEGVEPIARCVSCGKLLCASCAHDHGNRLYCADCLKEAGGEPDHIMVRPEDLEVTRSFMWFLDDPRWIVKCAIGSLFMLASLLILPFFLVLGYECEIIRSVAAGQDCEMPDWVDLPKLIKEGLSLFLIALVYSIPLIALVAAVSVLGVLVGNNGPGSAHGVVLALDLAAFVIGWIACLLYAALVRLAFPAMAGTYVRTGSIRESLEPGVIVGLVKADFKAYLLVFVLITFVTGTIAFLGFLALCIGIFITMFYAILVNGHLIGQLARLSPVGEDSGSGQVASAGEGSGSGQAASAGEDSGTGEEGNGGR